MYIYELILYEFVIFLYLFFYYGYFHSLKKLLMGNNTFDFKIYSMRHKWYGLYFKNYVNIHILKIICLFLYIK